MTASGLPLASTSQPTALEQLDDLGRRVRHPGDAGRLGGVERDGRRGPRVSTSTSPPTTRAPPYSASSSAARASATTVISGSTPRSKRLAASLGSRCRRAVRATPVGSQCAASSSTAVVPSPISVDAPPMTAASPIGPESSVISRSSVDSFRVRAVERGELLALAGQPDGDRPGDGVAVEGVHRLTELEHHVVGDVDGQRDAAHARLGQPAAQPPRARRGRVEPLHRDHGEAVAAVGVGDRDLPRGLARPDGRGGRARVAPRRGQPGAHLARDAAHGQAVAAVGRDRQLDDDVVQTCDRAGGRARRRDVGAVVPEHQDAGVVVADAELADRADHPVGDAVVGLPRGDLEAAREHGPGQRDDDGVADDEVGRAADDAPGLGLADVDLAVADRLLEAGQLLDLAGPCR